MFFHSKSKVVSSCVFIFGLVILFINAALRYCMRKACMGSVFVTYGKFRLFLWKIP